MASPSKVLLNLGRTLQKNYLPLNWDSEQQILLQVIRAASRLLDGFGGEQTCAVVAPYITPLFSRTTSNGIYIVGSFLGLCAALYWRWKGRNCSNGEARGGGRVPIVPNRANTYFTLEDAVEAHVLRCWGRGFAIDTIRPSTGSLVPTRESENADGMSSNRNVMLEEVSSEQFETDPADLQVGFDDAIVVDEEACEACSVMQSVCDSLQQELQQELEAKLCVICQTEPRKMILVPCGHLCLCEKCTKTLRQHRGKCPICRNSIRQTMNVYF